MKRPTDYSIEDFEKLKGKIVFLYIDDIENNKNRKIQCIIDDIELSALNHSIPINLKVTILNTSIEQIIRVININKIES